MVLKDKVVVITGAKWKCLGCWWRAL